MQNLESAERHTGVGARELGFPRCVESSEAAFFKANSEGLARQWERKACHLAGVAALVFYQ